jgi:signal transduction histidine kinase/CheY-like chemotaxis protein/CHASE3 domain sensor protein
MTFARRIAIGATVACLIPLLFALLIFSESREGDRQRQALLGSANAVALTGLLERLVVDMETGLRGFHIRGQEEFLEPYNSAVARYGSIHRELAAALGSDQERRLLKEIDERVQAWRLNVAEPRIAAIRVSPPVVTAAGILIPSLPDPIGLETGRKQMDALRARFDTLVARERERGEKLIEQRARATANLSRQLWIAAVGFSLLLVGSSVRILRVFNRRLQVLFTGLASVERGEYRPVVLSGGDEPARIANALNQMMAAVGQSEEELRRRANQIQESRVTLDSILDSLADGVVVADAAGKFVVFNPAAQRLLGRGATDADPSAWSETYGCFYPDAVTPFPAELLPLALAIRGESSDDLELHVRRHDRSEGIALDFSGRPILAADGSLRGGVVVFRDISERKQRYLQIQEASRLKSQFLANMSHELRTPLNAIIGFSELMHDGKAGVPTAEQKEYLGDILSSSHHLLQLINDVLDLSKVEAGKMELFPMPLDLERVAGEVRNILRTLAAQKRITIEVRVDPALHGIMQDVGKLKQIFYNYLSNALKFSPEDARVEVRLSPEGPDAFRLEVEDNGEGIRPEDIGKLFVEFQQLDASASKKYPGTGLGLALTKRLAEAQGGRVGVRSIRGKGSVFHAVLPRVVRATLEPDREPADSLPIRRGAPRVLVIDDDANDRGWLVRTLVEAGYSVETAATGAEAIGRCQRYPFDAITLDLMLPDVGGRDVLRSIREGGPNRDTPVLVVSIAAEAGAVVGFRVDDILAKPVRPEDLLRALRQAGVDPSGSGPIFVVDDDARDLKLAGEILRTLGYQAVGFSTAAAALDAARKTPPNAVVLDLQMPGIDGFEFLKRFRATVSGQRTPVIVWTARDIDQKDMRRLKSLAQAIVPKGDGALALLEELRVYAPPPVALAEVAHGR